MSLLPLFEDGEGRRSADPLALAGPSPRVDLEALGLLLAPPALLGEFAPRSPWKGVDRLPSGLTVPVPGSLPQAFADAVEELTTDARTIGVLVSGGLDSLAVLVHALRAARGRRVVAFATDLTDDTGKRVVPGVRRMLAGLELPADLKVIHPLRDNVAPAWSAAGPRLDALPEVTAACSLMAAGLGVDILLSGDGADELLGVPRFATGAVAARHGPLAAARYMADVAVSGPGVPGEVVAGAARLLPRAARARAYWAANWPDWCDPVPSAVLAEPYRSAATAWARQWVDDRIAAHAAAGRSWAESDAHDATFPRELVPSAGPVAEASPFLHESFLSTALALPLGDRYDPDLPSAYLRCKAQVVRLLPLGTVSLLPRRKQYFTRALARQATAGRHAPRCVAAGLLDPTELAGETDPAVLLVIASLERWLAGAEKVTATTLA